MRLVILLQIGLADVGPGQLLVELLVDQLLDHRALDLLADGGTVRKAEPLRFLRQQLVLDHVVEELLLALQRVVAGAEEGAGLVETLFQFVGGDGLAAYAGDHRAGLALAVAAGDVAAGEDDDQGGERSGDE